METVMYLSSGGIVVLNGEYKKETIEVKDYNTYPVEEGAMLNGVITDENKLLKALEEVARTTTKARLVLSSTQILRKVIVAPRLSHEEMLTVVADELYHLTSDNIDHEEMVYDYAIINDKVEGSEGIEVLLVGVTRDFIKKYLDIFDTIGIQVTGIDISYNVMNKLIAHSKELSDKIFIWANIHGHEVSVSLYQGAKQLIVQNSRFFSDVGTSGYVNEINSIIMKMINFNLANYRDYDVEEIMFSNVGNEEEEMLYSVIATSTELPVRSFLTPEMIKCVGEKSVDFEAQGYLYNLGALIRR